MNYKRASGESEQCYIERICSIKDSIGSWNKVADIINRELGKNCSESAYRKPFQQKNKFKMEYIGKQDEGSLSQLSILEAIEKEKIKLRDERTALNTVRRENARAEEILDILEDKIANQGRELFDVSLVPPSSENDSSLQTLLVGLSDLHIGANFSNEFGEYNTEIALRRMRQYCSKVIRIGRQHNATECYVALLGDNINGNIHTRIAITNKENVIEQIKICADMVCVFLFELSKAFDKVVLISVNGNHSRLTLKDEALKDERLDDLIPWYVEASLSHIDKVEVLSKYPDSTVSLVSIRDNCYAFVHGDMDTYDQKGAATLSSFLGVKPYAIMSGHNHRCALDEYNGTLLIRSGCMCGSGDDYTIEKRLVSEASQMVCVCNDEGVQCAYPVKLK